MTSTMWFCGYCGDGPFTTGVDYTCSSCGRDKEPAALDADPGGNIISSLPTIGRRHGYISITPLTSDHTTVEYGSTEDSNVAVRRPIEQPEANNASSNGTLDYLEQNNPDKSAATNNQQAILEHRALDISSLNMPTGGAPSMTLQAVVGKRARQTESRNTTHCFNSRWKLKPCFLLFSVGIIVVFVALFIALYWALALKDPLTGFTMMTGIILADIAVTFLTIVVHRDCQCFTRSHQALEDVPV